MLILSVVPCACSCDLLGSKRLIDHTSKLAVSVFADQITIVYQYFMRVRRKMSDDESDHFGQLNFAKLKSLRENVNWNIEDERREFLRELYTLIRQWKGRHPNLRDVFRKEEIDWLLTESVKSEYKNIKSKRLVHFVIFTGYRDEPDVGEDGKPLFHRTTPLHRTVNFIDGLFEIYDRYDVNYTDERGFTHFHVACKSGRDEIVKKFLKLGQDPNCVVPETGDSPLHLALENDKEGVFETLLKNGANPNLVNAKELTPLHVLGQRHLDDNLVDRFFKICDEKNHLVPIDPLDNQGRTPLQTAVSNFLPHVVGVLLDRGADLSKFVFPADCIPEPWAYERWNEFRLRIASRALGVVEHLEKRGYQMDRSDATTIMKFFAKYKMFEKSTDLEKFFKKFKEAKKRDSIIPRKSFTEEFGDGDEVAREAKERYELQWLSLYDFIGLRSEKAEKSLTFKEYVKFSSAGDNVFFLYKNYHEARTVYLCEKISKRFFRGWALEPFLELIQNRLPILCCEAIIENLMNEDLWHICLAAESPIYKNNVQKCNSERPGRARKAPKRLQIEG